MTKTFGAYGWEDYGTVAQRRANLGAGLMKLHRELGVTEDKFGVGLWSQNRPEWQITGKDAVFEALLLRVQRKLTLPC